MAGCGRCAAACGTGEACGVEAAAAVRGGDGSCDLELHAGRGPGGKSARDGPTASLGQAGCRVPLAWPATRAA
ncbi:hypothetical protein [Paenibacillus sp. AGC30]